jgi:hypothetical protein
MRYYIASRPPNANDLLQAIRDHWGIENSVHWILDVAFREDQSRVRKDHASENLAVMQRIALNPLRKEKTAKGGIQAKRLQCGWDETTSSRSSHFSAIARFRNLRSSNPSF